MTGPERRALLERRYWVFDLDGTLTKPILDFPKIKRSLGLPTDRGILEVLAEMEPERAEPLAHKLSEIELNMARQATAAEGARTLLEELHTRGTRMGILTRNKRDHALETLHTTGMLDFFQPEHVLGRDEAEHKPSPDGVLKLLTMWGAQPGQAVMTGDFLFDLQAGRAAGTAVVYVDAAGRFPHRAHADIAVARLDRLL